MIVQKKLKEILDDKIEYHNKLRLKYEATEQYEECARHRDEMERLKKIRDANG